MLKHSQKHMKTRCVSKKGCNAPLASQAGYQGAMPAGAPHPAIPGFGANTTDHPGFAWGSFSLGTGDLGASTHTFPLLPPKTERGSQILGWRECPSEVASRQPKEWPLAPHLGGSCISEALLE